MVPKTKMGSDKGRPGCRLPFRFFAGAQAMTLATEVLAPRLKAPGIPVLKTERLMLRAPRRHDVKTIARFANDRRVAENTARIPHPYTADDAEQFVVAVNRQPGEATFVILLDDEP